MVDASAILFDGLIAAAAGRTPAASPRPRAAGRAPAPHDTPRFANAARDRLGRLLGGDEGASLRRGVRSWLEGESVRDPERMLAMLLPGP